MRNNDLYRSISNRGISVFNFAVANKERILKVLGIGVIALFFLYKEPLPRYEKVIQSTIYYDHALDRCLLVTTSEEETTVKEISCDSESKWEEAKTPRLDTGTTYCPQKIESTQVKTTVAMVSDLLEVSQMR